MHDDDVAPVVHGHLAWWASQENEQRLFENAYRTEFWLNQAFRNGNFQSVTGTSVDEELPVKIEANRLWRFVKTHTSHLFYRALRCSAHAPSVVSSAGRGRPKKVEELLDLIEALVEEWLDRTDVQNQCTYAYQLALFHSAAFKLGVAPGKGDILDRLWIRVCPRWECVWDDRVSSPEDQLFIGHMSYLLDYKAEQYVKAKLPEDWPRVSLPDQYVDSTAPDASGSASEDQVHPGRYVRVLEFYDFEEGEQRFYLVEPRATDGPGVIPFGKATPMPYTWPSGKPACPLFPIVLDNEPKWPMRGIPSVRRIYRLAAEDNLMGSIMASRARRASGAIGLYRENELDTDFAEAWRAGKDMVLAKVKGGSKPLPEYLYWLPNPVIDPSIDKTLDYVTNARLDTEATSPQMSGAQSKYATAGEVELQNQGSEAHTNELGERMADVLGRLSELALVIVAAEESKVTVRRGAVTGTLTREQLRMPWHLTIHDAGTTPAREAARKKDWGVAMPMIKDLVLMHEDPVATDAMRRFAAQAIDETVQKHNLSENLSSSALFLEEPAPPPPPEPALTPPAPGLPVPGALPQVPAMGVPPMAAAATGMPVPPIAPPMPPGLLPPLPPSSGIIQDPATGAIFDEATGVELDPATGRPLLPTPGQA